MSTGHTRLRDFLPNARELALLFAARVLACMAAWHAGFRALSDDNYARLAIAQRFAHSPSIDPTGTSWLPAPFWIYGAVFRLFGTGLDVARATAIAGGLAATVLIYASARLLGAAPFSALLGAAFSAWLAPYSAILGIAAVPEVPCAALLMFGTATLAQRAPGLRNLGGASLSVACLSRYEAWPIALVFALYSAWDAWHARRPAFLGSAFLSLAGLVGWLAWGRVAHGDALFFVARVASYRRALGGEHASLLRRLVEYPRLLLWEGLLLWPLLLVPAFTTNKWLSNGLASRRALVALSTLLAFLMLGSARDGVPTHHAARVLLPIWFFASIVAGQLMAQRAVTRAAEWRVGVVVTLFGVYVLFRSGFVLPQEPSARRAAELDAGQNAQRYTRQALAIDTPDYGYFAVQAAFGSPGDTIVLDDHDPRHSSQNPFRDAESAERALRGSEFALVSLRHVALLEPHCGTLWQNEAFALLSCRP